MSTTSNNPQFIQNSIKEESEEYSTITFEDYKFTESYSNATIKEEPDDIYEIVEISDLNDLYSTGSISEAVNNEDYGYCDIEEPGFIRCNVKTPEGRKYNVNVAETESFNVKTPKSKFLNGKASKSDLCNVKTPESDLCNVNTPEFELCNVNTLESHLCNVKTPESKFPKEKSSKSKFLNVKAPESKFPNVNATEIHFKLKEEAEESTLIHNSINLYSSESLDAETTSKIDNNHALNRKRNHEEYPDQNLTFSVENRKFFLIHDHNYSQSSYLKKFGSNEEDKAELLNKIVKSEQFDDENLLKDINYEASSSQTAKNSIKLQDNRKRSYSQISSCSSDINLLKNNSDESMDEDEDGIQYKEVPCTKVTRDSEDCYAKSLDKKLKLNVENRLVKKAKFLGNDKTNCNIRIISAADLKNCFENSEKLDKSQSKVEIKFVKNSQNLTKIVKNSHQVLSKNKKISPKPPQSNESSLQTETNLQILHKNSSKLIKSSSKITEILQKSATISPHLTKNSPNLSKNSTKKFKNLQTFIKSSPKSVEKFKKLSDITENSSNLAQNLSQLIENSTKFLKNSPKFTENSSKSSENLHKLSRFTKILPKSTENSPKSIKNTQNLIVNSPKSPQNSPYINLSNNLLNNSQSTQNSSRHQIIDISSDSNTDSEVESTQSVSKPSLKCPECPIIFNDTLRLNRHRRTHQIPQFQCLKCLRKFKRINMLKKHVCDIKCQKCPEDCTCAINNARDCMICQKINFKYFVDYKQHVLKDHNEIIVCKFCEKNNYTLYKHKQLGHDVIRSYKCTECTFILKSKERLEYHMETHEKHFECSKCSKVFSRRYLLKQHKLTHDNPKQFYCDICDKSFKRKFCLDKHQKVIHGDKKKDLTYLKGMDEGSTEWIGCEKCPALFKNEKSYRKHSNHPH